MQLIYTAEHLQVLWPCAPPGPHSGKWRGTCFGAYVNMPTIRTLLSRPVMLISEKPNWITLRC